MNLGTRRAACVVALTVALTAPGSGIIEAVAGPPDPVNHTCPPYVLVVGTVDGGSRPDPAGIGYVVVRDIANNPVVGARLTLDFTACCDISLCTALVNGQTVDCANGTVEGITDAQGRFEFTVLGASNQVVNCYGPGCNGSGGDIGDVKILAEGQLICWATAVCLDQDGATGLPGANQANGADLGHLASLVGNFAAGGPYRGRGDLDNNGVLNGADLSHLATHVGRLALTGGAGCPTKYCSVPSCP